MNPGGYDGSLGSCLELPSFKCTSLLWFPTSKRGILTTAAPGERLGGLKELTHQLD